MKNIYCIVGPSGSGKTTVAQRLERDYALKSIASYTTRPHRYPDEEGHIFVSDEVFDGLGNMCAYTEYNGYRYGVTPGIIDENDIYVIDPYGVKTLLENYDGEKGIVAIRLMCDTETLKLRMLNRGDDILKVEERLHEDAVNFGLIAERGINYDLILPNYNEQSTVSCIASFIGCCESVPDEWYKL